MVGLLDIFEHFGTNNTGDASTRKSVHEYGFQSILCADIDGSYLICSRFEIGTLCQSSTSGNIFWYVGEVLIR
jgi:hypothetical protein